MDDANVQGFVDEPTREKLNGLKKSEIMEVAKLLEIPVKASSRKDEIRETVTKFLIKTDVWTVPSQDGGAVECSTVSEQIRLKELELETKKIELEMKKLDVQRDGICKESSVKFDAATCARLVPKFSES